MMKSKFNILLIEDSLADVKLITIALQSTIPNIVVRVARDGEEGWEQLKTNRPDYLLLDLNIPKRTGLELLQDIRSDSLLRTLPVIVLSNSSNPKDVNAAYSFFCNAYVRKPVGFEKILDAVEIIRKFWMELAIVAEKP